MNRILLIFFIILGFGVYAQKEANYWYFGNNDFGTGCAGVKFNLPNGPPTALNNGKIPGLGAPEGVAAISDKNTGQLLFYSDGLQVWNKNHIVMPNGNGLTGNTSSTQAINIVQLPGSDSIYYLFTTVGPIDPLPSFAYSIVDISLNGGLGDVIIKNVLLDSSASEKQTFVKHENCDDVWIITHQSDNDVFNSYLLSSGGLTTTPVISHAGNTFANRFDCASALVASHCGNYLCMARYGFGISYAELFDFNVSTGIVSNARQITSPNIYGLNVAYGIAFSPDDSKMYIRDGGHIYQYDLNYGSSNIQTVIDSAKTINLSNGSVALLELAPNGKIYSSAPGSGYLSVINYPNKLYPACSFVENGLSLSGGTYGRHGLPHFFYYPHVDAKFYYDPLCAVAGSALLFRDSSSTDVSCGKSWQWDFGDSPAGTDNNSSLENPSHLFSLAGSYTVTLITASGRCNVTYDTTTKVVKIKATSASSEATVCEGKPALLDAGPGSNYLWSTNAATQTISVTVAGKYYVTFLDAHNCSITDSIAVAEECDPVLFVPNSFTPNGDNTNDLFYIYSVNIKTVDIKIFNRWGELIFSTTDILNGWDGKYKDEFVQEAVYVYSINGLWKNGSEFSKTGIIAVIK